MILTNEGAILALGLLGLFLGFLLLSSVAEWLGVGGRRNIGKGPYLGKSLVSGQGQGTDDRIMSVTVNFPWMNGSYTAEPVLEKVSRN